MYWATVPVCTPSRSATSDVLSNLPRSFMHALLFNAFRKAANRKGVGNWGTPPNPCHGLRPCTPFGIKQSIGGHPQTPSGTSPLHPSKLRDFANFVIYCVRATI